MQRDYGDIVAVNIRVPEDEEDLSEVEEGVAAVIEPPGYVPWAGAAGQASAAPEVPAKEKEPGEMEKQNAAKLVDMKGVAAPPPFSGDDSAWQDWRFRFQTITALLDMREVMKLAAECPREIKEDELSKENGWKGRMLYGLLVVLVSGRALGIVRQVPEGHGLEAWRCLVKEYEPAVATRYCAVLAALLTPVWTETGGFMEQLVEWERRLRQYEAMAGEKLSDALKCAVVTAKAPHRVKDFLRLSPTDLTGNYGQLREAIRNFLAKGRVYTADGTGVDAMEVGAVLPIKGGGKAKGLSQQRPGQQRQQPKSQGPRGGCFGCGGPHRQADCSQRRGQQQQRGCRSSSNAGSEVSGSNSSREAHAEAALDVVDLIDSKIALDDD